MNRVNYDLVAPGYDRRYTDNRFDGILASLQTFLEGAERIAEVGCGTGHWLRELAEPTASQLIGLDLSARMLERARGNAPGAMLVRGTAGRLPWADASLDRIFCVNALHHFAEPRSFLSECYRVLRFGGGVLTIGLDPHQGDDQWWVYDFFPSALTSDRERYRSTKVIRDWLGAAGFAAVATAVAQHLPAAMPFETARDKGFLDRQSTSQLMVISDDAFEAGMTRLQAAKPVLHADLRLYASLGWRRPAVSRTARSDR